MEPMEAASQRREGAACNDLVIAFHRCLLAATRNTQRVGINESLEGELRLYLRKGVYTVAQVQASHEEHRRIFEAIRNGRITDAAEVFEAHVLTGKQRMLDTVTGSSTRQ